MFRDEDGTDLPDLASAETEASRVVAAHLRDHPREPWRDGDIVLTVADASGLTLLSLTVIAQHSPAAGGPRLRRTDEPVSP
ncbi:MAG TPA: hypothetical protein VEA15_09540 [Caulobacteraceae bacterium]|nr:hypothetical protein [Caulobacteraceae bacterium]